MCNRLTFVIVNISPSTTFTERKKKPNKYLLQLKISTLLKFEVYTDQTKAQKKASFLLYSLDAYTQADRNAITYCSRVQMHLNLLHSQQRTHFRMYTIFTSKFQYIRNVHKRILGTFNFRHNRTFAITSHFKIDIHNSINAINRYRCLISMISSTRLCHSFYVYWLVEIQWHFCNHSPNC